MTNLISASQFHPIFSFNIWECSPFYGHALSDSCNKSLVSHIICENLYTYSYKSDYFNFSIVQTKKCWSFCWSMLVTIPLGSVDQCESLPFNIASYFDFLWPAKRKRRTRGGWEGKLKKKIDDPIYFFTFSGVELVMYSRVYERLACKWMAFGWFVFIIKITWPKVSPYPSSPLSRIILCVPFSKIFSGCQNERVQAWKVIALNLQRH